MKSSILLILFITSILAQRPAVPESWKADVRFVFDPEVSDDFNGSELDRSKWDPHGARIGDTGCPAWNGPPSTAFPDYSTYFTTTTDPATGRSDVKQYRLSRGRLLLKMDEKPLSFFTSREYYCNATTFRCNHDPSVRCFATDVFGNPKYADPPANTTFSYLLHDKCKIEPYCIPHPVHVTGQDRIYKRFVGAHLRGLKEFKYGYVEVMARLGYSPAVAAAWMYDDHFSNGYCRVIRQPGTDRLRFECPSAVRSRRWQEIDFLESMNSRIHRRQYIPNVHLFAGYKGEFTSKDAVDNADGSVGGGPIIVEPGLFGLRNPSFEDVPQSERQSNDYHYNPGSVYELDTDWARQKRRLGVYWSPNEIRFLVDGKEVRRVKNNLIHQAMSLDLSYALNVAWAQEFPKRSHLRSEVKFFHIRRWEVMTRSGEEPPSDLPMDVDQDAGRGFQDLFGDKLGGVYGRFPQNDDETVAPTSLRQENGMEGDGIVANISRVWRGGGDYLDDGISVRKEMTGMEKEKMKLMNEGFKEAGGKGNTRFARKTEKMTETERVMAEAREDKIAKVTDGVAEMMEDAATTVYEHVDPNSDQAGWSTRGGLGLNM